MTSGLLDDGRRVREGFLGQDGEDQAATRTAAAATQGDPDCRTRAWTVCFVPAVIRPRTGPPSAAFPRSFRGSAAAPSRTPGSRGRGPPRRADRRRRRARTRPSVPDSGIPSISSVGARGPRKYNFFYSKYFFSFSFARIRRGDTEFRGSPSAFGDLLVGHLLVIRQPKQRRFARLQRRNAASSRFKNSVRSACSPGAGVAAAEQLRQRRLRPASGASAGRPSASRSPTTHPSRSLSPR